MRTMRCALVAAFVSAGFIAGCGEDTTPKKVDMSKKEQPTAGTDMLGEQMKTAKLKEKAAPKP